jgi:hypothetical protein
MLKEEVFFIRERESNVSNVFAVGFFVRNVLF